MMRLWLQGVLFESKLANMCLRPKLVDETYLTPEELALLRRSVRDYGVPGSEAPVFTHTYDSV
jgi:hypothetical protein